MKVMVWCFSKNKTKKVRLDMSIQFTKLNERGGFAKVQGEKA